MERAFMSHREAANYLGVAEQTLYTWVSDGRPDRYASAAAGNTGRLTSTHGWPSKSRSKTTG